MSMYFSNAKVWENMLTLSTALHYKFLNKNWNRKQKNAIQNAL